MKIKLKQSFFFTSISLIIILTMSFSSCTETGTENSGSIGEELFEVPLGFPRVIFPEDNPYNPIKAELGRRLFYEKRLSKNNLMPSCSHCMKQSHGFSDCSPVSLGYGGDPETRNTMSLANVAYRKALFWDGRGKRIEQPAYRSLFLPYILNGDTNEIEKKLKADPIYPELFRRAFGENAEPKAYLIGKAIATFVRTLISGNSAYDKYIRGDKKALTESQIRGMKLFFSDRTNCSKCHSGFMFTDEKFHNTAVVTHYFDRGRYYITKEFSDIGKFITPTLRNVEVNPPYMHNGELHTLEEVIEHYNRGGKLFINKDTLIRPLDLSYQEKTDLINFLKALTDWEFIKNPKFAKPLDMK
jgi:cytochrome c peroxidase